MVEAVRWAWKQIPPSEVPPFPRFHLHAELYKVDFGYVSSAFAQLTRFLRHTRVDIRIIISRATQSYMFWYINLELKTCIYLSNTHFEPSPL